MTFKTFFTYFRNLFPNFFKYLRFISIIILITVVGTFMILDHFNLISLQTGGIALPPSNVTKLPPTVDTVKYPYIEEVDMRVYFHSFSERTETLPEQTSCWGESVNGVPFSVVSFSSVSKVTVINGGCTYVPFEEVYSNISKAYPQINWVKVVDGVKIP